MYTAQGIVKPKRLEFDKKDKTSQYGKFIAGPFERGYGVTMLTGKGVCHSVTAGGGHGNSGYSG